MNQILKVAVLASCAVIFVTFIVLMLEPNFTGNFTYSAGYKQFTPQEACAVRGCIWDLEVQRGIGVASPHVTPLSGCICQGERKYFPTIERVL